MQQSTCRGGEAGRSVGVMNNPSIEYIPAQCLREEVERFKATNTFTPMDVTGFYLQAAVVLNEHRDMMDALKFISINADIPVYLKNIAHNALPFSETRRDIKP